MRKTIIISIIIFLLVLISAILVLYYLLQKKSSSGSSVAATKWDPVKQRNPNETDNQWAARITAAITGTPVTTNYNGIMIKNEVPVITGKTSLTLADATNSCLPICNTFFSGAASANNTTGMCDCTNKTAINF